MILGVLFLVRFALGYQFQAAGSIGPMLVRDLGIDWADLGTLVGAFMVEGGVLTVRFTYRGDVVRIFGARYWRRGKAIYERENQIHG